MKKHIFSLLLLAIIVISNLRGETLRESYKYLGEQYSENNYSLVIQEGSEVFEKYRNSKQIELVLLLYLLGDASWKLHDTEQAIKWYSIGTKVSPTGDAGSDFNLKIAAVYLETGNYEIAQKNLVRVWENNNYPLVSIELSRESRERSKELLLDYFKINRPDEYVRVKKYFDSLNKTAEFSSEVRSMSSVPKQSTPNILSYLNEHAQKCNLDHVSDKEIKLKNCSVTNGLILSYSLNANFLGFIECKFQTCKWVYTMKDMKINERNLFILEPIYKDTKVKLYYDGHHQPELEELTLDQIQWKLYTEPINKLEAFYLNGIYDTSGYLVEINYYKGVNKLDHTIMVFYSEDAYNEALKNTVNRKDIRYMQILFQPGGSKENSYIKINY